MIDVFGCPVKLPSSEDKVQKRYIPIGTLVALVVHKAGQTEGGITLPDNARDFRSITATVIAVGPDCKQVKEGDTVICPAKTMCHEVWYKGEVTQVVDEKGLLAVVIKESLAAKIGRVGPIEEAGVDGEQR